MPVSEDLGQLTGFMLSLAEDPQKLEAFRRDPEAAGRAAGLRPTALALLKKRSTTAGDNTIIVVIVVVVV